MNLFKGKKGMQINELYGVVLLLVMVGMIVGVGMITLGNLRSQVETGLTNATAFGGEDGAAYTINATNVNISDITVTWLPLIITIAALAIVLTLVLRSFAGAGR